MKLKSLLDKHGLEVVQTPFGPAIYNKDMDKPVSKPTAPAEPAPSLEHIAISIAKNWRAGKMCGGDPHDVADELLSLLEEAEKDAARYRWLRDTTTEPLPLNILVAGGDRLDAAIDAAMTSAV